MKKWLKLILPVLMVLPLAFFLIQPGFADPSLDAIATQPRSRMEQIQEQQRKKAENLSPSKPDKAEHWLEKYIGENPTNKYVGGIPGLHLRLGGTPSGGGFGLGPEYLRPDLIHGNLIFRASAISTDHLWHLIDAELRFPNIARRFVDLRFYGRRVDANSLDYYGSGPDSQKAGHTNYRREENSFDFSLALKPIGRYLKVGIISGYQWINIGRGQSSDSNSTEKQYSPKAAPGIDIQTNYLHTTPFIEVDSRDRPRDPHAGTYLLVRLSRFRDEKHDRFSFRQIDESIEHYISFFNKKRIIALRARTVLTYPDADHVVPFYMQPTLGGGSTLRGYGRYRFYDNNLFLLNAEYRWEIFTLMDAALFLDSGKVFHRDGDFDFDKLQHDAGFGFRFKTRDAVVFRLDTAFSHEGAKLWLLFDYVF